MLTSTAIVVANEHRDAGNRFFCAIGEDRGGLPGTTLSIKLSANGQEPPTHWACHTMASDPVWTTLAHLKVGALDTLAGGVDLTEYGTTDADVLAFGNAMSLNTNFDPPIEPYDFFMSIMSGLHLQIIHDEP
jgi:hypothetical protein